MLTEARRQLEATRNAMRCAASDRDRDPLTVSRHSWKTLKSLHEELKRLRERWHDKERLVGEYETLIELRKAELAVILDGGARIKQLIKLAREINRTDRTQEIHLHVSEAQYTSERVTDLRCFIEGYRHEVKALRSQTEARFLERETSLIHAIELQEFYWSRFVHNHYWTDEILDELSTQAAHLEGVVRAAESEERLPQRALDLAKRISALEAELAAESGVSP